MAPKRDRISKQGKGARLSVQEWLKFPEFLAVVNGSSESSQPRTKVSIGHGISTTSPHSKVYRVTKYASNFSAIATALEVLKP